MRDDNAAGEREQQEELREQKMAAMLNMAAEFPMKYQNPPDASVFKGQQALAAIFFCATLPSE